MAFSQKQKEYFMNATHRWNIKSGATRSGKTYMDYFVIPKRIRSMAGKEGLTVLLGNTKGTLQRNIIEPLQAIWGVNFVSDIRSDNTAILFGEKVHCLGADKISQVDRLRGSSVKYCYGDEIVTWHPDVFEMLKSRLDRDYSAFDGTCNPDNPNHWFKKFIDSNADIYCQKYTLDDNPFLADSVKKNIKKEYFGTVFYDRYVLGEWVRAEGVVFPMFANNPEKWIVDKKDLPDRFREYEIGFDIGGNNSAYAMTCTAQGVDGVYYVLKSRKRQAQDLAMHEVEQFAFGFIDYIKDQYGLNVRDVNTDHNDVIINTFNEKRYIFNKTYKPPLEDRPFAISMLLAQGKLKFVDGECDDLIEELQNLVYDDKSDKTIVQDNGEMQIDTWDSFIYIQVLIK